MWIFEFSLGVCSMELRSLVSSLEYLVSNGRQVLLEGIGLGGSATSPCGISLASVKLTYLEQLMDTFFLMIVLLTR